MPLVENKTTKLLVVDDDAPTRRLLRSVLGKQGYEMVEAANGVEAVAQVQAQRPDLILMDVMMPELDGYGACAQIRLLDADDCLPIIMLTGAEDMDAIESAFNAGATDFITKPINWALLTQRVRYALRTAALNKELRRNRFREASIRKIARLGYWDWNLQNSSVRWSDQINSLTEAGTQGRDFFDSFISKLHPGDQARVRQAFLSARDEGRRVDLEMRISIEQDERVFRLVGERGSQAEDIDRVFGVYQDVTESRKTQALVDFLALHDELTGLSNRRLFIQQASQALEKARAVTDAHLLLGWLDLTRFQRYNETLGEAGANRLLVQVAQRLRTKMLGNSGSEVARVGGDEFAIMLQADSAAEAIERFTQLLDGLSYDFKFDEQELFLSFSAGIALYPDHGAEAEQLLAKAQDAQRLARSQGRVYLSAVNDIDQFHRQQEALELEHALRKALDNQEFFLEYQPQLEFASNKIVGCEALLRWRHPKRGVVSPVQFIPMLEEFGLINEVGAWVLQESFRQAAQWVGAGLPLRMSANLSPRQFLDPNLFDTVAAAVQQAGVPPQLIELEITESLAMQDVRHTIQLLDRFRREGFKIAVDDFGIGHSSLEYLLRFPIDVIKIDRAFINNITGTRADRAIVRGVTVMAQTLNLSVIAEGVETQRQSDFIEALGVNEIQGYLIGKPMSPEALEQFVRNFKRPS